MVDGDDSYKNIRLKKAGSGSNTFRVIDDFPDTLGPRRQREIALPLDTIILSCQVPKIVFFSSEIKKEN